MDDKLEIKVHQKKDPLTTTPPRTIDDIPDMSAPEVQLVHDVTTEKYHDDTLQLKMKVSFILNKERLQDLIHAHGAEKVCEMLGLAILSQVDGSKAQSVDSETTQEFITTFSVDNDPTTVDDAECVGPTARLIAGGNATKGSQSY